MPKIIALRVDIGTRFPAEPGPPRARCCWPRCPRPRRRPRSPSRADPACPRYPSGRSPQLRRELTRVRAQGWALADEELAPGVRSVAAPVRDGTGAVRAAMNVTVHAAETSTEHLLERRTSRCSCEAAARVSGDWALWESRPHVQLSVS